MIKNTLAKRGYLDGHIKGGGILLESSGGVGKSFLWSLSSWSIILRIKKTEMNSGSKGLRKQEKFGD
jgi:hypothetical protein